MIGIIYDEIHPLLERIGSTLESKQIGVEFVHWRDLALSFPLSSSFFGAGVVYLDRLGESCRSYATQIRLLSLVQSKTKFVNKPEAYWIARDKALAVALMSRESIPFPKTQIVYGLDQVRNSLNSAQDFMIAKTTLGCCAEEVEVISSDNFSENRLDAWIKRDGHIILQEFVSHEEGFIWRIDIVNGRIIVANKRYPFEFALANPKLPICNGTQGGKIEFVDPSSVPNFVSELAVKTTSKFNLDVAGVDILIDKYGNPFVCEVNPEPDITLDRFEFPDAIAEYLISLESL